MPFELPIPPGRQQLAQPTLPSPIDRVQHLPPLIALLHAPLAASGVVSPSYLDGSLAGDYGFDPLGLGANPERLT